MKDKSTEGAVYLCDWQQSESTFEIRVRHKPEWKTIGESFLDAESRLLELLEAVTGDLQPCLEYQLSPPQDSVRARFEGPGLVAISGANDPLDYTGLAEELFSGGICSICRKGIGERSRKPLAVREFPKASDGAFVRVKVAGPFGNINFEIFSKEFLDSLSPEEKDRFLWLPVQAVKSKREFFEPLSAPLVPSVMPKGLFAEAERLQPDGFLCRKCGRAQLSGIPQGGGGIYSFISEADLPPELPSCFQIGQEGALYFCMPKIRWSSLVGKPGTNRLMSRQVGVVRKGWVNAKPMLQIVGG
jgi:hypothetical protein